jgi:hypothetical protein
VKWWMAEEYDRPAPMDFSPEKMPVRRFRGDTTPHLERTDKIGKLRLVHTRAVVPERSWETAGKRRIFVRPSMRCLPV